MKPKTPDFSGTQSLGSMAADGSDSYHSSQLCPNCHIKSYEQVFKDDGTGVFGVSKLKRDGWRMIVDKAGMAKPCDECSKRGLPAMPDDPFNLANHL